jgi:hypothetical protein
MAQRQMLLLKFAEKLYRALTAVTEAPPLYVVYKTMSFPVKNYSLTKDSEINVFTVTLCLKLNHSVFYV